MLKKGFYTIFVFFAFISCSKKNETIIDSATPVGDEWIINPIIIDDLTFNLADDYTIENSISIEYKIEKFLEFSPEILENKSEIEYAVCQIQGIPEADPFYQELGWTKAIQIKIKIKDETTLPQDWDIAGSELFYYLGSGRIPGCLMQTRQEHLFSGCLDENINLFTDNSFTGIDEIKPYTFKKETPKITTRKFRQLFLEQFRKFGGRQLSEWTSLETLRIEKNLDLKLLEADDTILCSYLYIFDPTKPLQNKDDFYMALCAMISITEPYLEKKQIEQFASTIKNAIPYLEGYTTEQQIITESNGYWMPSGNKYYIKLSPKNVLVEAYFEDEE